MLAERLAQSHIEDNDDNDGDTTKNNSTTIPMNKSSDESTDDESEIVTPPDAGFFIASPPNNDDASDRKKMFDDDPQPSSGLPPWPTTPPPTTTLAMGNLASMSCPRPSSSSSGRSPRSSPCARPLFISSSSGALRPPTNNNNNNNNNNNLRLPPDEDMGPASRAAAALRALETKTYDNNNDDTNAWEMNNEGNPEQRRNEGGVDITRQDTFRSGNNSGLHLHVHHEQESHKPPPSPKRTFDAYPSKANESIPTAFTTTANNDNTNGTLPSLYTFSPNCLSGKILTVISQKFVPPHKQHTHGGSALAGFFALLLVTCANYMLGPMRDAAALAVGVSHIPALTLASTVLALGSSVPVGWLFEAPNPMRRRVWKRMGLTRGETQGTSLALFYRVFAFLLLSYALGFKLVDKVGRGKDDAADGGRGEDGSEGEESTASAIALIATFFLRLLMKIGVPVRRILKSLEGRSGGVLGMQKILSSTGVLATYLESYGDESVPALFLHACASVVNKFGKVIYIMFFLVVHLMKLHSLSLIWGVTTEAMEYEETAEKRAKEKNSAQSSLSSSSAGGLVVMGGGGQRKRNDNTTNGGGDGSDPASNNGASKTPSKSSLRLKRLGFVGFGGTLGGILGSVIASFAAQILNLSGLLILAAILLELSANLSVELGRIMQRHWEEQMKYISCGDLTSLLSAENLAGQQQATSSVDSSMRKSASLGSMKRIASGAHLSSGNLAKLAAASQQQQSGGGGTQSNLQGGSSDGGGMTRARSIGSMSLSSQDKAKMDNNTNTNGQVGGADEQQQQPMIDDNSFKQRLLRGITTILRSRLLISIFTYNALYASTSVLLSFQRAELVANRSSSSSSNSAVSNTAFLAKINTASSVAVFALQASGLGAYIANSCGQRGALALMPVIRLCGVILLGWWHLMSGGQPPDLISFLVIDEFCKVINFAIAKPVRENLWRGLSAEARYEAKPIVDTLANRWGGGSAAFLVSFISRITDLTGLGVVNEKNGERSIFGFPPVLLLCMIISAWWTAVSADVGNIRRKIDLELKKQL